MSKAVQHVAESQVMGRNAVAVVVACIQPVAFGQLFGRAQGSRSLDALGVGGLADAWAIAMLLAGVLMIGAYIVRRPDDTGALEIAAGAMVATVSAVHMVAVLHEVGWSGSSWVSALDVALIVNCGGYAIFRARQIWWVARRDRGRA